MNFNQHLFVLHAVNSLMEVKRCGPGRTLIQKTLFMANELHSSEAPFPFSFILYKHGPYSFDVDNALHEMSSYGAVRIDAASGCGVMIRPDEGMRFTEEYGGTMPQEAKDAIARVSGSLAVMSVKELERVATALWIYSREGIQEREEIAPRLRVLKPHITDEGARDAVSQLYSLLPNA